MSGLINSAGSKSGVIGTTELDYEEGTWTPVPNAGSFGSVSQNRYTRIGGYCFLSTQITNIQGGFAHFHGLPFTTLPSGTGFDCVLISGIMSNLVDLPSDTGDLACYMYNNNVYIYCARDDASWQGLDPSHMNNNDDLQVAFGYTCQ